MSTCRDCGQAIGWRQTPRGRCQPIDRDGTPHPATCPARRRPATPDDVCLACGSPAVVVTPGTGVHHQALRCRDCGVHRWLPRAVEAVAMTPLEMARHLHARGLSVIPILRPDARHDGKSPIIPWREFQAHLPSDAEITAWFTGAPQNIAVVTGAVSGVVVIDVDSPEALRWCVQHLPRTPWQTQTARGFHLWYRHPGVRVHNRARLETRDGRLAIDVRGDGGCVIAAGSIHASGGAYREAGDWTVSRDALPRFWPGWLQRPTRPASTRPPTSRPVGDVIERGRRYLAAIPRPEIGAGSDRDTLYAACRLVRGYALSDADVIALLWEGAGGRPGWTRDWIAQKVAHAVRYGTEPIGALR